MKSGNPSGEKSNVNINSKAKRRGGAKKLASLKLARAVQTSLEELERRQLLTSGTQALLQPTYSVDEGQDIIIDGSSSTIQNGATLVSYKWDFNYNPANGFHTQGTGNPVQFEGDDGPASQTIALRVTDSLGNVDTTTATINTLNVAPTLQLSGDDSVAEGATYNIGWSASDPANDTISSWVVNWGDGSQNTTVDGSATGASHVFNNHGDSTITVTATDEDGSYQITKDMTVTPTVPVVQLSGNDSVNEGTSYRINFSSTDAGGDSRSGWVIDWGDGTVIATGASASTRVHTYLANGPYTVKVTALSADGDEGFNTLDVNVLNVPPSASITGTPTDFTGEGVPITVGSTASDVGTNETLTRSWSVFKDGSEDPYSLPEETDTTSNSFTFTPRSPGSYVIRLAVSDGTDTTTVDSTAISVTNVYPTSTISGTPEDPVNEGSQIDLHADASDSGADDELSYSWSVTRGEGETFELPDGTDTTSADFSFTPTDNGTYTATVTVSDNYNGFVTASTTPITVLNVAPTGTITGEPFHRITEGTLVELGAHPHDVGAEDTNFTYSWSVKKGTDDFELPEGTDTTSQTFSFTPTDQGTYVASCQIIDKDNDSVTKHSADITVINANPTGDISGAPTEDTPEGTTLNLSVTPHDAGANDGPFTYAWSVQKDQQAFQLAEDPEEADLIDVNSQNFSFAVRDQGSYVVTVRVTDKDSGFTDVSTEAINVVNAAPVVSIASQPTEELNEGDTIEVSANASDPAGAEDNITYSWTVKKDDQDFTLPEDVDTTSSTLSFVAPDNGSYVATVRVTDKDEAHTDASTSTIIVNNADPEVTISGAPTDHVNEGDTISLTAHPTDAGSADVSSLSYTWSVQKDNADIDLGDGVDLHSQTLTFVAPDNGTYMASVVVTDKDHGTGSDNVEDIEVDNVAPTVTRGGEGQSLSATLPVGAADSVDQDGNLQGFDTATQAYELGGKLAVGVMKFALPEGLTSDDIAGAAFHAHILFGSSRALNLYSYASDSSSVTGDDYAAAASATNLLGSDILNSDDGNVDINNQALTQAIKDALDADQNYVVLAIRWSDNTILGGSDIAGFGGSSSFGPNVPALTITTAVPSTLTVDEGSTTTLTSNVTDPGADEGIIYSWSVSKGSNPIDLGDQDTTGASFDFHATDSGTYTVTQTATDKDNGENSVSWTVNVTNLAPTGEIGIAENTTLQEGTPISLSANVSDPGSDDQLTYAWSVKKNDVTFDLPEDADTTGSDFTFTPDDQGDYQVFCTVTDDANAHIDLQTDVLSVQNAPPTGAVNDTPTEDVTEGTPVTVRVNASDAGNDSLTYSWTVTRGENEPFTLPEDAITDGTSFTFTPTDNGQYVAHVTISDGHDQTTESSGTINVVNAAPTVTISGEPVSPVEGTQITLHATPHDAGAEDTEFTYSWSVKLGGEDYELPDGTDTASADFSFTPRNQGDYVATCVVTDKDLDTGHADSQTITVANVAPGVTITGAPENDNQVNLEPTALGGVWDNSTAYGGLVAGEMAAPVNDFTYHVLAGVVKFSIPEGLTADQVTGASLKLFNAGPSSGRQIDLYTFDSDSSDLDGNDWNTIAAATTVVASNIGGGENLDVSNEALAQAIKDAIGAGSDHVSFAIRLTDTTPQNSGSIVEFYGDSAPVSELAPSLTITTSTPVFEGSTTTLTANATDPGTEDNLTYSWTVKKNNQDFDTGDAITDQSSFDFVPDNQGDYVVTVTVGDGTTHTSNSVNITAINANPAGTVDGLDGHDKNEGDEISLHVNAGDPGIHDHLSYSWAVTKDNVTYDLPEDTDTTGTDFAFTATDQGLYDATVTITDGDGGSATIHNSVQVDNVAPEVTISGYDGAASSTLNASLPDDTWMTLYSNGGVSSIYGNNAFFIASGSDFTSLGVMKWQLPEGFSADQMEGAQLKLFVGNSSPRKVNLYSFDSASSTVTPGDYAAADAATNVVAEDIMSSENNGQYVTISGEALTGAIADAITNGRDYLSLAVRFEDNTPGEGDTNAWIEGPASDHGSSEYPSLTIDSSNFVLEGSTTTLTANTEDPGVDDELTYTWTVKQGDNDVDLTDQTTDQSTFDFKPTDNGVYNITVDVFDGTDHSTDTKTIVVGNARPSGSIDGVPDEDGIDEGSPVTLSVSGATDPGAADTNFTYLWSVLKDGKPMTLPEDVTVTGASLTFTPPIHGSYNAIVQITDKDGGETAIVSDPITVNDVAQTVTITGADTTSNVGLTLPDGQWGTISDNQIVYSSELQAGSSGEGELLMGVMKWQLPEGLTSDQVQSASLNLTSLFITGEDEVDIYAYASDSSGVVGTDYDAVNNATQLVASNVGAANGEVTLNGDALVQAIKDALDNNQDYVALTIRLHDNLAYTPTMTSYATPGSGESAPSLTIGVTSTPSVAEGSTTHLTANVTDPGVGNDFNYRWSVTKDEQSYDVGEIDTGSSTFDFTPNDNGNYVVSVDVFEGDFENEVSASQAFTVTNVAPTGTISGVPENPQEGTAIDLTANPSDAGSNDLTHMHYSWSVTKNDVDFVLPEDAVTNEKDFSFTPDDNGSYVVKVTISDGDGGTVDASTDPISVANVAPTGTVTSDITEENPATEGTPIVLMANPHDAGVNDTFTYSWSVKKGEDDFVLPEDAVTTGQSLTFTPTDNGDYVATCVITDNSNDAETDSVTIDSGTITVANANPTGEISGQPDEEGVDEGSPINLSVTPSDPGADDVSSLTYSWSVTRGESSYTLPEDTVTTGSSFSFTPQVSGSYVVTVTVTDKDHGHSDISTDPITVNDVPPSVTITGLGSTTDNVSATLPDGSWSNAISSEVLGATGEFVAGNSEENTVTIMKWQLPDGLTADDIQSATLTLNPLLITEGPVDAVIFSSNSDQATSGDYDQIVDSDTTLQAGIATSSDPVVISNEALVQAIKDALNADQNYISIGLRARDSNDPTAFAAFASPSFGDGSLAPTLSIGVSVTPSVEEGSSNTLTANVTDPGQEDSFTYSWSVTKGEDEYDTGELATDRSTFTFAPRDNGDYIVHVRVTDGAEQSATADYAVNVTNVNPTAEISQLPESPIEGTPITLTVDAADASPIDTVGLTYLWSVKKNNQDFTLPEDATVNHSEFTFTPDDDGLYNVSVTVTDKDSGSVTKSTGDFNVADATPTATFSGVPTESIVEGDQVSVTANPSDPGVLDTFTYKWHLYKDMGQEVGMQEVDLPEGTVDTDQTITFNVPDNGTYALYLSLSDNTPATALVQSDTFVASNANPTGTVTGVPEGGISEGDSVTLTANPSDAGPADTEFQYTWAVTKTVGEEQVPVTLPDDAITDEQSFTWHSEDDGTYTATVTITDKDNGHSNASTQIIVHDVTPNVSITNDVDTELGTHEGTPITFTAHVTDPGVHDTFTYEWRVMKGTPPDGDPVTLPEDAVTDQPTFTFTPTDNGDYVVSCVVHDNAGGGGENGSLVTVLNANPTGEITGQPDGDVTEGDTVSLSVDASDPGADDVASLGYQWSVTRGEGETFVLPEGLDVNSKDFNFVPTDNGSYVVSVTVTDKNDGQSTFHTDPINVVNAKPTGEITGAPDGQINEGDQVSLTAVPHDAGAEDTNFTYSWSVTKQDDVQFALPEELDTTSATFNYTVPDNGSYIFTVKITDKDNATSDDVSTDAVVVNNVAPTGTIDNQPTDAVNEGTAITLTADPSDAGANDNPFTYSWKVQLITQDVRSDVLLPESVETHDAEFTWTPEDDGQYVATVTITDKDHDSNDVSTDPIAVNDVDPSVEITGDTTGAVEGTPMTLTADVTDPGIHDTFTYSWTVTDGDDQPIDLGETVTNEKSFTWTPADNANYKVNVLVTDNSEQTGSASTDTIEVANANPSATITGLQEGTIHEGDEINLHADVTDPGVNDSFSYEWSVKKDHNDFQLDHTVTTDAADFSFQPDDNGDYVVTCVITDNSNGQTTATSSFTAVNVAPTGDISGIPDGSITEGTPVELSVVAGDAGLRDTFTYSWSVKKDDQNFTLPEDTITTGTSFSFTPNDNGKYVAAVRITDKDHDFTDVSTGNITVTNVNPTATITGQPEDNTSPEGTPITLTANPHDAGSADTFTYLWSVKKDNVTYTLPENTNTTGAQFTFTPRDNGNYVVSCVVSDDDHGTVTASSGTIAVTNVNPTATLSGTPDSSITEGTQITINANASDAGSDDVLTYAWTVTKDNVAYTLPNSIVTTGAAFTFTPDQQGSYIATCTISDDDHGSVVKTTSAITVTNVAPTATVGTASTAVRGRTTTVNAVINDPGAGDSETISWDWGDGSQVETLSSANAQHLNRDHIYALSGNYTVSVTATDNNGAHNTATTLVTVKQAAIQVDPMDPDKTALVVGGTPGDDIIKFTMTGNGSVKLTINGAKYGTFSPTGHIVAYGDSGTNMLLVDKSVTMPAVLYGGSGKDILSGGAGNDVIIGRKGNDQLYGNGGRDVMIGGVGSDILQGGADDDILIGGTAVSMEDFNQLAAISNEWSRTDMNTAQRIKDLKGTLDGGLNGNVKLTSGWVFEEAGYDQLTGNAGRDWFFTDPTNGNDKIIDLAAGEDTQTSIGESQT